MCWTKLPNGCIPWIGLVDQYGYGLIAVTEYKRSNIEAHRISFELHVQQIPENLFVLHECDNPPCINPTHLFLGTQKENMYDKVSKNRQQKAKKCQALN